MEVPLHSHTPLSVYILHTPAADVQLNLLTGRKTTKASLTEYMLNTLAPGCICVCVRDRFCSVNTWLYPLSPLVFKYITKEIVSAWNPRRSYPGVSGRRNTPSVCVFVCAHMQACVQKLHVLAMVPLHWTHSCLTECVDTLQPPPFTSQFPCLLLSAVLQYLNSPPPARWGGQNIRLPLQLRAKVVGPLPSVDLWAKERVQRLMALNW